MERYLVVIYVARVDNKRIINRIARASLKNNKTRNSIAIIAIALTTLLLTALFTIGFGMKESIELQTMRSVGTTYHGEFKDLNEEKYEKLKSHPLIKEQGYRRMIGSVINNELRKEHVEISYGDENYIKRGFAYPTVGRLPIEKNEIITNTKVLDLLGIPHKVGEKIHLKFYIHDTNSNELETIEKEFDLVGFYPVDPLMGAMRIFTSKEYAESLNLPESNINLDVMFSNSFNIEKKLYTIIIETGYSIFQQDPNYIATGVNWGYMAEGFKNSDPTIVIGGIVLILIIILTGYLIIYNIFQISVLRDIRFYGLLKTIGTTSKQLKKIIWRQAQLLSAIGIPLGIVLGYLIGNLLVPIIAKEFRLEDFISISFSPLIFLFASAFSLATVFISSRKPGKSAGKVSPIESIRIGDVDELKYIKEKKNENEVKLSKMAISNLSRNKLRTIIVILSMSISLVLFNSIYTFTNGFNPEKYVNRFLSTDFNIGSDEYFKYQYKGHDEAITTDIINLLESIEGFINGGAIYYRDFDGIWIEDKNILELDGKAPLQLYGLDDFLISKQQVIEGTIDMDKFKSGDYIILGVNDEEDLNLENANYNVGDKITLATENGSRQFEVMALITYGSKNSARRYFSFKLANGQLIKAQLLYLPSSIYEEIIENPAKMVYKFDVEDEKIDDAEKILKGISEDPILELNYESKQILLEELKGMKNMFIIVGGVLSFIIGIVGIINFVNSIITSIMVRKKEFALLQCIGMTNRQLNSLLTKEGLIYTLSTIITTSFFTLLISITILKSFEREIPFFTYKFTVFPLIITFPIIILLGYIVPILVKKVLVKESIVERIRNNN